MCKEHTFHVFPISLLTSMERSGLAVWQTLPRRPWKTFIKSSVCRHHDLKETHRPFFNKTGIATDQQVFSDMSQPFSGLVWESYKGTRKTLFGVLFYKARLPAWVENLDLIFHMLFCKSKILLIFGNFGHFSSLSCRSTPSGSNFRSTRRLYHILQLFWEVHRSSFLPYFSTLAEWCFNNIAFGSSFIFQNFHFLSS